MRPVIRFPSLLALSASLLLTGCEDSSTGPDVPPPLIGLLSSSSRDSIGNPIPTPPPGPSTAGYARGTVLAPSASGAGNDSLQTAPRIIGARVAAFPINGGTQAAPTLGPEAGAVVTGADGRFTLPILAGGSYVVTITPPSGSIYGGVWVTTVINDQSHVNAWWVVLWVK